MVLESQYQSSLTKACQAINESRDDVCVECVGYLLEELRDAKNVAAFKKDVETSNIFIGSLIFVQVRCPVTGSTWRVTCVRCGTGSRVAGIVRCSHGSCKCGAVITGSCATRGI